MEENDKIMQERYTRALKSITSAVLLGMCPSEGSGLIVMLDKVAQNFQVDSVELLHLYQLARNETGGKVG